MSRPGDWACGWCQHLNFSWRDTCHGCSEPRFGPGSGRVGSNVKPGDWYCSIINCGAHNYASRSNCFKCGTFKDESADASRGPRSGPAFVDISGWKSGDWICSRSDCNVHNYASRMECYRCNTPREFGNEV